MYLVLFLIFLALCLALISIGIFRPEHTEFAIVGFAFMFILSFTMIQGDVQYKVGVNETNNYACLCCEDGSVIGEPIRGEPSSGCTNENATLSIVSVEKVDVYETFDAGGPLSHFVGYWMAVLSFVGFVITIVGLKKPEWFGRGDD